MTMFSKLSIRKSLIGGFLFCAALTTFLGGTGIFSLLQTKEAMKNTVGKVVTNADLQNSRIRHLIPIRKLVSRIIETNEMENLSKLNDDLKIIEKNIKKVNSDILILINELMAFKEQYISLNHSFEQSKNQNISYLKSISQLSNTSVTSTMDESISAIEIETESIMGGVAELISVGRKSGPSVNLNTDDIISKAGINDMVDELLIVSEMSLSSVRAAMTIQAKANFLLVMLDEVENSSDLKSLEQVSEKIFKIKGEINSEIVELPDDQTTQKIVEQLIVLTKTIDTMFKAKKVVIDTSIKFNNKSKDILLLISGVESKVLSDGKTLTDNVTATMADVTASVGKWLSIQIILVCVVVILALFIGLYLSGSISKSLNRVIQGLSAEAGRVKEVSSQVALAGQSLAEASSEQAASIEETSSSMEEMASMTRKNAQNASQADSLMKKTNQVVAQSNASMSRLTRAMEDISNASEETSKIIKTIDEIAFRTNLLALNAAVEAARAGEAGAGFAVVADEVRTLAMQAADAAKDTARLIKSTVGKVHDGFETVASTNKAFEQVAGSAGKVGDLVAQISEASNEQSIGIEQVNNAITEMDKVVQQNASAAEESASAAEDMSAYAGKLKNYVQDLAALVTGKHEKKIPDAGSAEVKPNQMISFNADEFETF